MKRLFIAIPIQDESRIQITRTFLLDEAAKHMPVRWTAIQNLHLTLQFLGDINESRIPDLKQILNRIVVKDHPIFLRFSDFGAFPNLKQPRILWLGIEKTDHLNMIHSHIIDDLERNGFEVDRKPFTAHLTLGRIREGQYVSPKEIDYLKEISKRQKINDSLWDRIILFESQLRPSGPVYIPIYEKKLI